MPRSSGTNSCAGTRKSKVKIFGKEAATSWRTAIRKSANEGKIRRSNSRDSHGLQCKEFLMSFLLAHCGGGQDQPGCLGPSAKRPGSVSRELKRNAVPSERSEFESILDSTLCGNDLAYPSHSFPALSFRIFLLRAFVSDFWKFPALVRHLELDILTKGEALYLCAACTSGQAIFTGHLREDRGGPAATHNSWGKLAADQK